MNNQDFVIGSGGSGAVLMQGANLRGGFVISAFNGDMAASPTKEPYLDQSDVANTHDFMWWGDNNDWPRMVRKKIEQSTIAAPLIFKAVCAMYGIGVRYWVENFENGSLKKEFIQVPEIEDFFNNNSIDYIVLERMMDFKYFNNIFQEFITSINGDKITHTFHLEAEFSRISKQNDKTHEFDFIGFCGNWDSVDVNKLAKIPKVDPHRHHQAVWKQRAQKAKKFAVHSCFPSPGRPYYAMPSHAALYKKNGWLDYSNAIPEILNAIVNNAMNLKYHIKIPATYWAAIHNDWSLKKKEERDKIIQAKLEEMNNFLTGKNNTMKSFITEYAIDPITNKEMPGWQIDVLDDKTKVDHHLLTSQEGDQHITRALGIDPSLAGLQPQGGKMGAGSGSDKRTAFVNAMAMSHPEEKIVLDFLDVVKKYNNWPANVRFGFIHEVPTTLDNNKSGIETVV